MCLLTNERYTTYQTGFPFGRLGHAPGVGLGGTVGGWGGQKIFFSEIQPDFVCELLTWMAHATAPFLGGPRPLGPWGGAKRSNIIKPELQSQFQSFFNQTLRIFSQMKDIYHIRPDFHLATWVMPRGGTWGYHGALGIQKKNFPKIN